jgi:DNA-binding CsgD family transcriptional regulator
MGEEAPETTHVAGGLASPRTRIDARMLRPAEGKSRTDPGVLALIAAGMCSVTGCTRSAVFLLDPERVVLEGAGAHGFALEAVTAIADHLHDVPLAAAAAEARAPVRCRDARTEDCLPPSWLQGLGLTAAAFVPLVSHGAPLAFVLVDCAESPPEAWPEVERRAVAFANVAALALDSVPDGHGEREMKPADQAPGAEPEQPRLTEQELKVLGLAADGLTNPEIGARLGLSRHTVKEYLSHAMRKLDAANRIEAVRKASRLGLLEGSGARARDRRSEGEWKLTYDRGEDPVETSDLKLAPIKIGRLREEREP